MTLPVEKEQTLNDVVADLRQLENVAAIVLGGSYATGDATERSDLDIGIYYFENSPFDIASIRAVAEKYAIEKPTVTGFYEWGPWVNGGAWIETACGQIDFIYKNIDQIKSTIAKAKNGEWENHFEQQPPFGFSSVFFLAETKYCIPLDDETGIIAQLKAEVQTYPPKLKNAIIQQSLWLAEFTILHADIFFKKRDIYNTVGCLTRAVKYIVNALFAINEIYPISDKRAIDILEKSNQHPENLKNRIADILCVQKEMSIDNIDCLKAFFQETVSLTNGLYKSVYQFKKD
ncbi:MAG TPA: nucleotidyltransferase domain-containing protein [Pyrinomonadaceae bacterium]|nr:nucleotidyltransferase domain-containing protein [Pyrinomonadaceae bacterium]